jgi:hypothetical protein
MEGRNEMVNEQEDHAGGLGTEISVRFAKAGLDSDIPEFQGHEIKPPSFEEE